MTPSSQKSKFQNPTLIIFFVFPLKFMNFFCNIILISFPVLGTISKDFLHQPLQKVLRHCKRVREIKQTTAYGKW